MQNYLEELPKNAKKIKGTYNWVDKEGNFYGIETRLKKNKNGKYSKTKNYGKYFRYNTFINSTNGYVYVNLKYFNKKLKKNCHKQVRAHRIIARYFVENPNNYPIVGHKNNIKKDIRADNLYWTTTQENTQKAYNDGLAKNDKGYEDSQSKPVYMFNTYTNELIDSFGSIGIAAKETGINKETISRQARYKKPVRKSFYFRFQDDESIAYERTIFQYDYFTDKMIGQFINISEASRRTGISDSAISRQCQINKKPKNKPKSGTYFLHK